MPLRRFVMKSDIEHLGNYAKFAHERRSSMQFHDPNWDVVRTNLFCGSSPMKTVRTGPLLLLEAQNLCATAMQSRLRVLLR